MNKKLFIDAVSLGKWVNKVPALCKGRSVKAPLAQIAHFCS